MAGPRLAQPVVTRLADRIAVTMLAAPSIVKPMNHKRKGPKSTRAGCLLCKPHKRQGFKRSERAKFSDRMRMIKAEAK